MYNLIIATDETGGIGKDNSIPWRLKNDLQHFKYKTFNGIIVMGRKTWSSLPKKLRPLKNRINVIISRDKEFTVENDQVFIFNSLEDCEEWLKTRKEKIWIIGGGTIYNWFMEKKLIDHIFLTSIVYDFCCDIKTSITCKILKENGWKRLSHDDIEFISLEYRGKMKKETTYLVEYSEWIL